MELRDESLYRCMVIEFSCLLLSWKNALKQAHVPAPSRIRRAPIYTPEVVLRQLQERASAGLPMNHNAVLKEQPHLLYAAVGRFGSYNAALTAVGILPAEVALRSKNSEEDRQEFLQHLRRVALIPESERAAAIRAMRNKYRKIVVRLYGESWNAAAKDAGVPYRAIHPRDTRDLSSREKVIEALKERVRQGKPLTVGQVRQQETRLYKAVLKYFSNYYDFYPEIGLSQKDIPLDGRRHWRYPQPKDVIAAIRMRHKLGLRMRAWDLCRGPKEGRDAALLRSACKYFGSWAKALQTAGIATEKRAPRRRLETGPQSKPPL